MLLPILAFLAITPRPIVISDHSKPPPGFIKTSIPPGHARIDVDMGLSRIDWKVDLASDCILLTKFNLDKFNRDRVSYEESIRREVRWRIREEGFGIDVTESLCTRVPGGWLLPADVGEWGGGLYWFSSDWKQKRRLWSDNVGHLFDWQGEKYALGGTAHLGLRVGYLLKINRTASGDYKAAQVHDLKVCPERWITHPDGSLLVLTAGRLIKIPKQGPPINLVSWNGMIFGSNSMVCTSDGTIYVGQNFYLLRLKPRKGGYLPEWYIPKSQQSKFKEMATQGLAEERKLYGRALTSADFN